MNRRKSKSYQWYGQAALLPEGWNEGLERSDYLHQDSLLAHELAGLPDVEDAYVAVQEKNASLKAAFQILTIRQDMLDEAALKPFQRRLWRAFLRLKRPRLLVAGHLFRHDVAAVQYTARNLFAAFRLYRSALRKAAHRYGAMAILVKDVPKAFIPYFQHHTPEFVLMRNDISMQLHLEPSWADIKAYEKSLKHKYAQRYRKVRQALLGLEIRELSLADVREQGDRLFELYSQVAGRQGVRLGSLNARFLPTLKAYYGDALKVWGFYEGENIVAWASAWLDRKPAEAMEGTKGRALDMFYIGLDYARNSDQHLYFNILFFALEQAIAHGVETLILGRTALEAKARLGCRPVYLHTFLYLRSAWLRRLVRLLQNRFQHSEGAWENRHPFKE